MDKTLFPLFNMAKSIPKGFTLLMIITTMFLVGCAKDENNDVVPKNSIKDDLGEEFLFEKTPESIVSLAPNLTEMIYSLKLDNKLKGNTIYCNYPPEAQKKDKIGDMLSVDFEKIISINPDIIFITVEGNSKGSYEKLRRLGFRVFVSNPRNYKDIKRTLRVMAQIFNKEKLAGSLIADWDSTYKEIRKQAQSRKSLKGMFAISTAPLMLCGKNTFMNEFLVDCGIKNIAENSPMNYPIFSREQVLIANPDIMIFGGAENLSIEELLQIYPEWENVNAIKYKRIITVNPDLYFRPGPRFILALNELNKKIDEMLN